MNILKRIAVLIQDIALFFASTYVLLKSFKKFDKIKPQASEVITYMPTAYKFNNDLYRLSISVGTLERDNEIQDVYFLGYFSDSGKVYKDFFIEINPILPIDRAYFELYQVLLFAAEFEGGYTGV